MFTPLEIKAAQDCVYASLRPTPQFEWPLLSEALGAKVWVKHENHQPVGAFKVRGGLTYFDALMKREPKISGVISATRGNHGQSIGFAASKHGVHATIVVPHGNSVEKNAAMRALGVELIEHGSEFQESREHAAKLAQVRGLHFVPSYHRDLLLGVMTYWIEFFEAVQPDVTYVPIGMGSGFCAAAAARAHTGLKTKLVGVVSAHATAYMDSFKSRKLLESPVTTQIADGMACRVPDQTALDVIVKEAHDVIAVTDDEVKAAMRLLFTATHNVAEGAGAASLAAAMQQKDQWHAKTIGTTLCGGNVDADVFAAVLAG
ncbi:threonine dehydratase [Variovorax sp. PCZ-1]|uniref:threonine dehydratase n=1 Tax=Variovorax sp. PCZ-1 TaxID=2835533 RepID=UPI001BCBC9A8|nr:threonine dehydratase [Variovorax sp. PCZ-1]MBS7806006.1 threonine dehydratase [Variovorax sp. PCZ-1]